MKKSFLQLIGISILLSLIVISCNVTKTYQSTSVDIPELYRDMANPDSSSIAEISWSEFFVDSNLKTLIERGISNNLDLQIAFNRIQQAQAYFLQSKASFLPSLDANASVGAAKLSEAQGFGIRNSTTQYQLGLSSSWEIDVWGKLKSTKNANLASVLQSEAGAKAVQTQLVSQMASYYFLLMALDQQLMITQQTIQNWDTTVQNMRDLKEAARVTEAAVVQSEAQRYAAEITLPDLRQRIRETENAFSILLGERPSAIPRKNISDQQTLEMMHTGVPAQLLANRPDVQLAEFTYRYYFEMTNVARTHFYPSLSITGGAGLNALDVDKLLDASSFVANIAGAVTQPIFNRKANETRLEVANLQQNEAMLQFKNSVLNAGREVSDALSLNETTEEKIKIRKNQMQALEKSVEYTEALLRNGFGNYIEIITARQSLLQAELGAVNDRLQQLQASVNLYRALGGGWK